MDNPAKIRWWLVLFVLCLTGCAWGRTGLREPEAGATTPSGAELVGRIGDPRLVECSGLDASLYGDDLFWAVNDGENGPFLYALGGDGRSRGQVALEGAANRDWEALATFQGPDGPMILVADVGDNRRAYGTYTLYIAAEPRLEAERFDDSAVIPVVRRIDFVYPDGNHDAEAVAVDAVSGNALILTKRDTPPILYLVSLAPATDGRPVTARSAGSVGRIPPPSAGDLLQPYGLYRSQPTGLDLSTDGRLAVVLTYKHAYLFRRSGNASWGAALAGEPTAIPLPPPEARSDLRQREAVCFSADGRAVYVTSEGAGAGLFRRNLP